MVAMIFFNNTIRASASSFSSTFSLISLMSSSVNIRVSFWAFPSWTSCTWTSSLPTIMSENDNTSNNEVDFIQNQMPLFGHKNVWLVRSVEKYWSRHGKVLSPYLVTKVSDWSGQWKSTDHVTRVLWKWDTRHSFSFTRHQATGERHDWPQSRRIAHPLHVTRGGRERFARLFLIRLPNIP